MKIVSMTCPNCGATLQVDTDNKNVTCNYCGNALFIDDEADHVKIENPEQVGYEFEKGRQRAQEEKQKPQQNILSSMSSLSKPKKRRTWLWVLGWILIFPVPLTILILRNQKLNKYVKIGILAVAWILYLVLCLSGRNQSEKTENSPERSIDASTNIYSISLFNTNDITIKVGQSSSGYVSVLVSGLNRDSFSPEDVVFVSNDPNVATIEFTEAELNTWLYFEITGIGPGETTVYACSKDESVKSEEIKVIVPQPIEVKTVSIENETSVLALGDRLSLAVSVLPDNADDKSITWESSDDSILTVDENGTIIAKGDGTAVITAKASSGVMSSQEWSVDGSKKSMTLKINRIRQDDNNIGDDWSFQTEINGENTSPRYIISIGDSLNCHTTITESDDTPDVGQASKIHVVSESDFESGFSVEMDVYVTENGGRNSGKSAHYIVTYEFSDE